MKLKTLLAAHKKYSTAAASLPKSLGDGYLLIHNPVYRNIRLAAKKAGYRFTADRFHDYDVLALTQLPRILKRKRIPYCDNVRPLRMIEASAPGRFKLSDVPPLRANTLLHESAHGVAHGLIRSRLSVRHERDRVLAMLLEESFANACESIGGIHSTTDIHDEFLFKNSYIMEELRERKALREAVDQTGIEFAFGILLLSFLYANFVATDEGMKNFDRVLNVVSLSQGAPSRSFTKNEIRLLKRVFKIGSDLDPQFTVFTNAFCLKLAGFRGEIHELLAFDFIARFETDIRFRKCLADLSRVVR